MPSRYAPSPAAPEGAAADRPFQCPICHRSVPAEERVSASDVEPDARPLVAANTPGWDARHGAVPECARRFDVALDALRRHGRSPPRPCRSCPRRCGSARREDCRGRGRDRSPSSTRGSTRTPTWSSRTTASCATWTSRRRGAGARTSTSPTSSSWHGMMTSVVAAGNGSALRRLLPRRGLRGARSSWSRSAR